MALSNEDLLAISRLLDTKLDARLQPMENRMERIENRMTGIENQVTRIENRMSGVENRVTRIEVDLLENNIIPRLNTIESCYTDTYNRYKDNADRMEDAFEDIGLLKKVVTEHSEKLQKIS